MEIDITFDTYIVSNAENEFCQKKEERAYAATFFNL